jgi:hypothetical protein
MNIGILKLEIERNERTEMFEISQKVYIPGSHPVQPENIKNSFLATMHLFLTTGSDNFLSGIR